MFQNETSFLHAKLQTLQDVIDDFLFKKNFEKVSLNFLVQQPNKCDNFQKFSFFEENIKLN